MRGLIRGVIFAIGLNAAAAQDAEMPAWQKAAGGKMAFEVASVKPADAVRMPNFPLTPDNSYAVTGGRLSASMQLTVYIQFAYKIRLTPEQYGTMTAHLPGWVSSEFFDIEAEGDPKATKDQMRLMMQSLLADRFRLAVHFESHQAPVLALTLVKPGRIGAGVRAHPGNEACQDSDAFPRCYVFQIRMNGNGTRTLGGRDVTMAEFGEVLPIADRTLGRVVVDRTGLAGKFDVLVDYTPESDPPVEAAGPTFREALRDQLGMKLESARDSVRSLVIDHVERPSEN